MSPKKLSESDKKDILTLYREPEETTTTLAARYGVSNSTISRFLKSHLSEQEYETLIQQKRSSRTHSSSSSPIPEIISETEEEEKPVEQPESAGITSIEGRRRRRSSASSEIVNTEKKIVESPQTVEDSLPLLEILNSTNSVDLNPNTVEPKPLGDNYNTQASLLEEMLREELTDINQDVDEDEDDELDEDEDLDLEDSDEDDWEEDSPYANNQIQGRIFPISNRVNVQVLPLSEASLPKTCYLVVDRAAELIARPLKEFGDLGRIPAEETQQKTLPIFDNHRVARRFSNRAQRVIKIPDGRMLQKTCSHLKAKGITRLLIDGQIYSLSL